MNAQRTIFSLPVKHPIPKPLRWSLEARLRIALGYEPEISYRKSKPFPDLYTTITILSSPEDVEVVRGFVNGFQFAQSNRQRLFNAS